MKKLFTLFVSLWIAMVSLFAVNMTGGEKLYLTPNSNWKSDNARFAAYFFGTGEAWASMTAVTGETDLYEVTVPNGNWTNVIFCRMNPSATANNWDNKWNQSGNLVYDGTKNWLKVPSGQWDKFTTGWTVYTPAPVIKVGAAPEFATTTVGETANATVTYTLENATEATANIQGEGFSIAEQSVGSVTITFAPEAEGEYTGTLTITSGDVKETVAISATAVAAEAPKVPQILNVSTPVFEVITEGESTTAIVTYKIANEGELTPEATITGEGFSIAVQETGSVTIEFTAATAGEYTGKLTITLGEVVKEVALAATAKAPIPVITIKVSAPTDWATCYIWAWTGESTNLFTEGWPGKAMTKGDDGFYTIDIETDKSINLLVSDNGQDSKKTADYKVGVTESTCFIIKNNTLVVNEECEFEVAPEPDPIEPYVGVRGLVSWNMADDIKMTYNAEGENGPEWVIKDLEIAEGQAFKVVSVDAKGATCDDCWYGAGAVEKNEALGKFGEGEDDITLAAGKYDIYFKVNSKTMWIAPVKEEEPEPEPIDPYAAIRGLGEGTEEEAWSEAQQIKLDINEDATEEEWFIKDLVIAEGKAFKVVYVNAKSETAWYGAGAVDKNEALGKFGEGEDNITLAAGKYDIYFKVASGTMWIAPVKEEEPDPVDPIITILEQDFQHYEVEVGDETEALLVYSLENAESADVTIEGEYVTFEEYPAEEGDEGNSIIITFAPEEVGEFPGKVTITAGEVSEEIEFTFIALEPEDDTDPDAPKINIIVKDFERNTAEVGDQTDAAVVYSLENAESADVTIEGEYVTFEQVKVDEGYMIGIIFTPEEVGEFPGKVTITAGEVSKEIEFTFIALEPEDDTDPSNEITFTVQVPEGTKECWIAGTPAWTFIQMEKVEGEENLYTLTVENTVLDGDQWKYLSGAGWAYVEVRDGDANRTEDVDPYDVVTSWKKLYDPDFEPIEPYYAIRGLNGDSKWTGTGDIKLVYDETENQWSGLGFIVAEGESFKVVYINENGDIPDDGYYAGLEENCNVGQTSDKDGNIVLPAGKYNLYFKPATGLMWISIVEDTTTDAEEAVAELIYAAEGTIYAPAPFAIIDLSGKDVTNANGSLQGTYLVKTLGGVTKISVK